MPLGASLLFALTEWPRATMTPIATMAMIRTHSSIVVPGSLFLSRRAVSQGLTR